MKLPRAAVVCILLLAGCTGHSSAGSDSVEDLGGTYINRTPDGNNYLLLSADGRGVTVTQASKGRFRMLMTFDWTVDGSRFHQTRVRWTADGRTSYLSHDESTRYRLNGNAFETQATATGNWIRWEPTDGEVFKDVTEAVAAKFSQNEES